MRRTILILAASLVYSCGSNLIAAAQEHTRLIEAMPPPPFIAPEVSQKVTRITTITRMAAGAGPWFNQTMIYNHMKANFQKKIQEGLGIADSNGQEGVLIHVEIHVQKSAVGHNHYSLISDGASLVGVGPDAMSVCVARTCSTSITNPPAPPAKYAPGTGYYWVERVGNGFMVNRYDKKLFEESAWFISNNEQVKSNLLQAAQARAVDDYAKRLASVTTDIKVKQQVQKLIEQRNAALEKVRNIEANLRTAMARAQRASDASNTLSKISGFMSLASTIATASLALGEDISKASDGAAINNHNDVVRAVDDISKKSSEQVNALKSEVQELQKQIKSIHTDTMKIGQPLIPVSPDTTELIPLLAH